MPPETADHGRKKLGRLDPFSWVALVPLVGIAVMAMVGGLIVISLVLLLMGGFVVLFDMWSNRPIPGEDPRKPGHPAGQRGKRTGRQGQTPPPRNRQARSATGTQPPYGRDGGPRTGARQAASRQPGARQAGGRQQPGARQPAEGRQQPGSRQAGARQPGARQPGARQQGSRQAGARQQPPPNGRQQPQAGARQQPPAGARQPGARPRPQPRQDPGGYDRSR